MAHIDILMLIVATEYYVSFVLTVFSTTVWCECKLVCESKYYRHAIWKLNDHVLFFLILNAELIAVLTVSRAYGLQTVYSLSSGNIDETSCN